MLLVGWLLNTAARGLTESLRVKKCNGEDDIPHLLEICLIEKTGMMQQNLCDIEALVLMRKSILRIYMQSAVTFKSIFSCRKSVTMPGPLPDDRFGAYGAARYESENG